MNLKDIKPYLEASFDILVIIDLILIIISLPIHGLHLVDYAGFVKYFDLTICALLLIEFFYGLFKTETKGKYFKEHFLDLIASIPFDIIAILLVGSSSKILNITRFLRLIRVIRVLRAVNIVRKYNLEKLIRRTGIDKILLVVAVVVTYNRKEMLVQCLDAILEQSVSVKKLRTIILCMLCCTAWNISW